MKHHDFEALFPFIVFTIMAQLVFAFEGVPGVVLGTFLGLGLVQFIIITRTCSRLRWRNKLDYFVCNESAFTVWVALTGALAYLLARWHS